MPVRLELIPARPAVRKDATTILDVLIRIEPTAEVTARPGGGRPALNLALVIDRSGSMGEARKLDYAREAATYAVAQLLPSDRVSVTAFDSQVKVLVPSRLAAERQAVLAAIAGLRPGDQTSLFDGWKAGSEQVAKHLDRKAINRVLLLTDGLANVGLVDHGQIVAKVGTMAREGVSTSTLGLGAQYDPDLLGAMADGGDGNYYYVETPQGLEAIFTAEFRELVANLGSSVSLRVEPLQGAEVKDALNDLPRDGQGRWQLANLVAGMPLEAVIRFRVPPHAVPSAVARVALAWTDPQTGQAQTLSDQLELPAIGGEDWENLPIEPRVSEAVGLLIAARAQAESVSALRRGDLGESRRLNGYAQDVTMALGTPRSGEVLAALQDQASDLEEGRSDVYERKSLYAAWRSRKSKS